jgi:hypothetical protein
MAWCGNTAPGTQITPARRKMSLARHSNRRYIQTDVKFIDFEVIVMLEFAIIMLAIAFGASFLSVIRKRVR